MKKSSFIILIILCLCFSVLTCSDSEKRLSPLLNQTKVIIDLGLDEQTAHDGTIWDKIRSLFVKDAVAQSAPASFISILVRVNGLDFGVMEQTFGPIGTISLNVPSGSFRLFEVIAYVAPGDPSAALSFSGAAIANLSAGDTVTVPVFMTLNETKIVIPDGGYYFTSTYAGLVMMDDMNYTNWIHRTATDFTGFSGTFKPIDIDYDARGRIYIANNGSPALIRMDDINGKNLLMSSATIFGNGTALTYTTAIAVDRINKLVYFSAFTTTLQLYRAKLDGTSTTLLTSPAGMTNITGIDVDNEGMLYLVGPTNTIVRYNPNTQLNIAGPYTTNLSTPNDVLWRPPYIYIANRGGVSGVLKLTINNNVFSQAAQFGVLTTTFPNDTSPNFYGAYRFLAIRNDLIIADSSTIYCKLLSIHPDPLGAGWIARGQKGITSDTPGTFLLFSSC